MLGDGNISSMMVAVLTVLLHHDHTSHYPCPPLCQVCRCPTEVNRFLGSGGRRMDKRLKGRLPSTTLCSSTAATHKHSTGCRNLHPSLPTGIRELVSNRPSCPPVCQYHCPLMSTNTLPQVPSPAVSLRAPRLQIRHRPRECTRDRPGPILVSLSCRRGVLRVLCGCVRMRPRSKRSLCVVPAWPRHEPAWVAYPGQ
jgi:hypothetical protein